MTGLDITVLESRLDRLAELLALLRRDRGVADRIAFDVDVEHRVERRLQLAAQVAIDVANYLIARFRWTRNERESLWDVLAREQVIPLPVAEGLQGLTGFRNVLVHEYLGIDLDVVRDALNTDLDELDRLRDHVLKFIEARSETDDAESGPS